MLLHAPAASPQSASARRLGKQAKARLTPCAPQPEPTSAHQTTRHPGDSSMFLPESEPQNVAPHGESCRPSRARCGRLSTPHLSQRPQRSERGVVHARRAAGRFNALEAAFTEAIIIGESQNFTPLAGQRAGQQADAPSVGAAPRYLKLDWVARSTPQRTARAEDGRILERLAALPSHQR